MTAFDAIKSSTSDPRRFIGRPAAPCRKCHGVDHYVNQCVGIQCVTCNQPGDGECVLRLTCHDRTWFESGTVPAAASIATSSATSSAAIHSRPLSPRSAAYRRLREPDESNLAAVDRLLDQQGVVFTSWVLEEERPARERMEFAARVRDEIGSVVLSGAPLDLSAVQIT